MQHPKHPVYSRVTTLSSWFVLLSLLIPECNILYSQAKKFFVNVPSFLTWIFWIFKPLLSAATVAKMSVVGSGPKVIGTVLLPLIPADQLPKRYGGDADGF
jgi:hypothetical protein